MCGGNESGCVDGYEDTMNVRCLDVLIDECDENVERYKLILEWSARYG